MSEHRTTEEADVQRRALIQGAGLAILGGASTALAAAAA